MTVLDLVHPELDLDAAVEPEPFPYAYAHNFGNTRDWPLRSWAQLDHLAGGLGATRETAFLIVRNTCAPRTAQAFGRAGHCLVELLNGWNVWRARRPGQSVYPTTVEGSHRLRLDAWTSELLTAGEATPIMRQWLEHGELAEGLEFREPPGVDEGE